jgi:hypothetical protein
MPWILVSRYRLSDQGVNVYEVRRPSSLQIYDFNVNDMYNA